MSSGILCLKECSQECRVQPIRGGGHFSLHRMIHTDIRVAGAGQGIRGILQIKSILIFCYRLGYYVLTRPSDSTLASL